MGHGHEHGGRDHGEPERGGAGHGGHDHDEPERGGHDHGGHHHHDRHHDEDPVGRFERLDDPAQYRYLSAEELRTLLDPGPDWVVADLGSGTGFFADELAPVVDALYAVDVRRAMHDRYRTNGMPANVAPVTADVTRLPLADGSLDGAVSIRTFHHGVAEGLDEVARVLRPGGRLVVLDWSATGAGQRDRGPRPEDCFDLAAVQTRLLDAGFRIRDAHERRETFVVVAARRSA